jgi:predicted DNA-binding protein
MKRKYLVFLDIDGVFTSDRVHFSNNNPYPMWVQFDPVATQFMNKIHDTYPVEFVIMSTWKEYFKNDDTNVLHLVEAMFRNSGFRGVLASPWKTNPDNLVRLFESDRAYEVKEYLETYATDVEDYLLFDDTQYKFKEVLGKSRLVHTDSKNGLLYKHMLNASSMMGTWNER